MTISKPIGGHRLLAPQAKTGRGRVVTSFSRKTIIAIVSGDVQSFPMPFFNSIGRHRFFAPQAKTGRGRAVTSFSRKIMVTIVRGGCQSIPVPNFNSI